MQRSASARTATRVTTLAGWVAVFALFAGFSGQVANATPDRQDQPPTPASAPPADSTAVPATDLSSKLTVVPARLRTQLGLAEGEGVLIDRVGEAADPLRSARVARYDVLLEVDGQAVTTPEQAADLIAGVPPESRFTILVVRRAERIQLTGERGAVS